MTGDELVAFAFGSGIERTRDESGRALGEHVAGPLPDADFARLKFSDPRDASGLPANVAALASVGPAWPFILHVLVPEHPGTFAGMLDATRTTTALVTAHVLAGEPIPEALGAAYKVSIGFGLLLRSWALIEGPSEPPSVPGLLATLDSERWLVGQHHVCPGARRAIAEVWSVMLGSPASDFGPPVEVADARALRRALSCVEAMLVALHVAGRKHPRPGDPLDRFSRGSGRLNVALEVADHVIDVSPERASALAPEGLPRAFRAALSADREALIPAFTRCATEVLVRAVPMDGAITGAALEALRM